MNSYLALKKHYYQQQANARNRQHDIRNKGDLSMNIEHQESSQSSRALYIAGMALVALFVSAVWFGIKTDCPNTAYYVYCSPK
ncbi:hypothetical protein TDB9533_02480 [Thalassocella blandensis]|nr:hypothetical protein TDB9533_02480 [Thalassocella blandensis]